MFPHSIVKYSTRPTRLAIFVFIAYTGNFTAHIFLIFLVSISAYFGHCPSGNFHKHCKIVKDDIKYFSFT